MSRCKYCKEEIELDSHVDPLWIHSPLPGSEYRWYTCMKHFRESNRPYSWISNDWEAEPDMEYETVTAILTKYSNEV